MSRALTTALALALLGCGAAASVRPHSAVRLETTASEISGVRVIARSRAGTGHFAAALFVRAPSDPPALATAAALVIEARSGGRLVARATADGITLRTTATTDALAPVVNALGTALASRDATPDEVATAVARIRARRAGRANDDRARAARLAVAAMFGEDLDPLGSARDDERLTSEAVSELLRLRFGAEQALIVVAGDVSVDAVTGAIARAFADVPHVDPAGVTAASLTRDARVETSEHDVVAVARRMPDLDAAERAGAWAAWADPGATVSAFPLHGVAVLLAVRDGAADDATTLAARIDRVARLAERPTPRTAVDVEGEVLGLGDEWLASGDLAQGEGLGVGVVVAGDRDAEDDETEALRSRLRSSLGEPSVPTTESREELTAERAVASGARVRVQRVRGASLAVAIAFDGGASLDARGEHGRAALLAALLGQSCEPDAEVTWVDARSLGLVISGEPATLERTMARAVDCVRGAGREAARADGVRADAIALLDDAARARAWAASAIAPATPGLVAPLGSSVGIAAASGLDAALSTLFAPARATIVVVGDVDPAHAIGVAEALASELPAHAGPSPSFHVGAVAASDVFVADPIAAAPEVILTLRTDAGESVAAARATARALAEALRREGGHIQFWFGDAALGSSFVAVGVRGDDALLDAIPSRVPARLATLDPTPGLADAIGESERRRALGSPLEVARAMASAADPSEPSVVIAGLLSATPRYVMVRPSPGPMRPPRHR